MFCIFRLTILCENKIIILISTNWHLEKWIKFYLLKYTLINFCKKLGKITFNKVESFTLSVLTMSLTLIFSLIQNSFKNGTSLYNKTSHIFLVFSCITANYCNSWAACTGAFILSSANYLRNYRFDYLIHTRHSLRTTNIYMSKVHLTLYLRQLHGSIPTGSLRKPKLGQYVDYR